MSCALATGCAAPDRPVLRARKEGWLHRVPAAAQNGGSRTCSRGGPVPGFLWHSSATAWHSRVTVSQPESYHLGSPTRDQATTDKPLTSRGGRIRTGGLLLPKQN
jgi:hypothetical protein